jgi:hypothetical protein
VTSRSFRTAYGTNGVFGGLPVEDNLHKINASKGYEKSLGPLKIKTFLKLLFMDSSGSWGPCTQRTLGLNKWDSQNSGF